MTNPILKFLDCQCDASQHQHIVCFCGIIVVRSQPIDRLVCDSGIVARDQVPTLSRRKEAEAKVVRLNRVYSVLSGINTTIVRVHDRNELFAEACRIAVEHGKFRMAWIGLLDLVTLDVTPAAKAGHDDGYIPRSAISPSCRSMP